MSVLSCATWRTTSEGDLMGQVFPLLVLDGMPHSEVPYVPLSPPCHWAPPYPEVPLYPWAHPIPRAADWGAAEGDASWWTPQERLVCQLKSRGARGDDHYEVLLLNPRGGKTVLATGQRPPPHLAPRPTLALAPLHGHHLIKFRCFGTGLLAF